MAVTGTAVIRFKTIPAGYDAHSLRIVIGGAGEGNQGNQSLMDPSRSPVYGEAGIASTMTQAFPNNGVIVTRVPYTFPDANTLANAPQRTKEELARFVEKNWIEVLINNVVQTALQVRTMTP